MRSVVHLHLAAWPGRIPLIYGARINMSQCCRALASRAEMDAAGAHMGSAAGDLRYAKLPSRAACSRPQLGHIRQRQQAGVTSSSSAAAYLPRMTSPLCAATMHSRLRAAHWQQQRHASAAASRSVSLARRRSRQDALASDSGITQRSSLLYIGPGWPEPSSTAAGVRTRDLITAFSRTWDVHMLSPAKTNKHSEALEASGVTVHRCPANRQDDFLSILEQVQPQVCVFDRYYTEEAFSFMVQCHAPSCMRVLDMQDMHALRQGRMEQAAAGEPISRIMLHRPTSRSPVLLRELASIHRSDLTLVCSPVELQMLQETYGISAAKMQLAPFFVRPAAEGAVPPPGFAARRHFVSIGNFKHPPNLDSVKWLAGEVWDEIRDYIRDSDAELHMYGAYPSAAVQRLHDPARNLLVKGHMASLETLRDYRVLLAPLRFGAGLKGKVVDAWEAGLPVVTTEIGSEGMTAPPEESEDWRQKYERPWGGIGDANTASAFGRRAGVLYTEDDHWQCCQDTGYQLLAQLFDCRRADSIREWMQESASPRTLNWRRQHDFVGHMLWQQVNRSTEYFSRWVELKETAAEQAAAPASHQPAAAVVDDRSQGTAEPVE